MNDDGTARAESFDFYTKARNHLFDVIIPEVTGLCPQGKTAGLILFIIERKAAGYHQTEAEVSIPDMESFTNASLSDIKRARSWLIAEGYVEVLFEGNGLETSRLRIVLDSEERKRVKAAQKDRNNPEIRSARKPAKIISRPAESACPPNEPSLPLTPPTASTRIDTEGAKAKPHDAEAPKIPESEPVESHHQAPDPEPEVSTRNFQYESALTPALPEQTPQTSSQISENENAHEASKIKGCQSEPPSRGNDLVLGLPGLKKKTNIETQAEIEEKKAAFGAVCSFARSQKIGMEDRDYAFAKWAVDSYGARTVEAKMEIARFQTARGVKFSNPLGWFRNALAKDYQPSKFDSQVLKAHENSRRQSEKAEREKVEREAERQKHEKYREQNPDAANNAYQAFLRSMQK